MNKNHKEKTLWKVQTSVTNINILKFKINKY